MKVRYDDGFGLWVNDAVKFGPFWGSTDETKYFDLNLVKDQLYSWYTEWCQGWCGLYYALYMNYPGVSYSAISSSNLFLPSLVGASPYNINITDSICGDGFRTGTEAWDDGNKNSGDGWSSTWSTESGWTCSEGSQSNKDIWSEICGDGIRFNAKTTYWDDGNNNNGDGWSSVWSTEFGWTCSGGSKSNKDICSEICGDGITIKFKCEIKLLSELATTYFCFFCFFLFELPDLFLAVFQKARYLFLKFINAYF